MNIQFVLRDSKKKDGTRTIRCYIQHNGRAYYNTPYSVLESDFKKGRIREGRPNAIQYNSELIRLRNEFEGLCLKYPERSASEIIKIKESGSTDTFIGFFKQYIKKCESRQIKRSLGTVKNYKKVLNSFVGENPFPDFTDFQSINKPWYDSYTSWLRKKSQNENTVGSYIKVIKLIMREAYETGITTNEEFRKKYFKKTSQETDEIYLNESEIKLLEDVDLSQHLHLEAERDRFLIQYYFLLRFSDSLKFDKDSFYEEGGMVFMRITAGKTGIESIIPVKKKAYDLLVKYDFNLNVTNQEANRHLKIIAALAGIDPVKSLRVKTHTARRSGATNLFLQGCPDKVIMDLGGWKKADQFRQYLKISKLESARKASEFDFYK